MAGKEEKPAEKNPRKEKPNKEALLKQGYHFVAGFAHQHGAAPEVHEWMRRVEEAEVL